jgi:hypothetical protein
MASMKKGDKLRKQAEETMAKIRSITRHIRNVEDNCFILGEKLIMKGEIDLGHRLIAHGFIHDSSKFYGIEWESLVPDKSTEGTDNKALKLKLAISNHNTTNPHHPEHWNGIGNMPRVFLAEMVCDWKSRSEEFGSSLRDWITGTATKRWGFTEGDKVYKEIMEFVELLCDKPFTQT